MTATVTPPTAVSPLPTRHREAEARGRRLGRPLLRFGGIDGTVDELLMARLGAALLERDEPGAALAHAIRTRAGEPGRVSHAQLKLALASGIDAVPDAAPALRDFMTLVTTVPDWVDWDLVDRGGRLFSRLGRNAADALTQLSLIGGYRFGGPTDLLVATGGLTGERSRRRLAETQLWGVQLYSGDALRPGGEAWRTTVHVRVMHAIVNAGLEPRWDVARWGLPINQADQAGTLGLFDGTTLLGCRGLGVPISRADEHAYMHMWKYIGWLMGVDDAFLTDSARERHRINYHVLLAAPAITAAGPQLTQAIYDAQAQRRFPGWPAWSQAARGRWEQERMLSMLTMFLGPRSMDELGLAKRLPWAFAYLLGLNTLRYRALDRLPGGTARREAWGRRQAQRLLDSYFIDERHDVAALPGRG